MHLWQTCLHSGNKDMQDTRVCRAKGRGEKGEGEGRRRHCLKVSKSKPKALAKLAARVGCVLSLPLLLLHPACQLPRAACLMLACLPCCCLSCGLLRVVAQLCIQQLETCCCCCCCCWRCCCCCCCSYCCCNYIASCSTNWQQQQAESLAGAGRPSTGLQQHD